MIYATSRLILCFLLSVLSSTIIIRVGLSRAGEAGRKPFPTAGFWIGFFETVLIFVFVIEREYTGLALIVAATQFLGPREAATEDGRVRYRLASLVTTSVAVIFALIARIWVSHFLWVLMA